MARWPVLGVRNWAPRLSNTSLRWWDADCNTRRGLG